MMDRLVRLWARLRRYAHRPWYTPAVATSATLDYFFLASPAQSLFIATVLLNPARRLATAAWFSVAAALGALLLAAGVQLLGGPVEAWLAQSSSATASWQRLQGWIDAWGVLALLGLSVIPVPLRTAVILTALAGVSFLAVGVAVLLGRGLTFAVLAQVIHQTPRVLQRLPWVRRWLDAQKAHAQDVSPNRGG